MIAQSLMRRIQEVGYEIQYGNGTVSLVKKMDGGFVPAGLLAEVKRHREKIIELVVCSECGRVTTSLKDMAVLKGNFALCDSKNCPYRRPE